MNVDSLSIIIPVKNRAKLVCRALNSILAQTVAPEEVIVVDNNSSDGTLQAVKEWESAHAPLPFKFILTQEKTPGACAARNLGASISSGNLLLFFDSDDTTRPTLVENILQGFSDSTVNLIYWKKMFHFLDGTSRQPKWCRRATLDMHVYHALYNTIGIAMRKELFMQAGMWNKEIPCWNDWELGIRLHIFAGENGIKGIDEVLVDGHMQKESITGTGFLPKFGKWEISLDAAKEHSKLLPENKRKHYLRSINLKHAVLAAHYNKEGGKEEAEATMEKILKEYNDEPLTRFALKSAYAYTSSGFRGAFSIFGKLI